MRLAAIDIGTNSVHMIVVRVRPDFSFEVIDREKEMVRLGSGGLDGKKLTHEAMTSALQALSKFERLAKSHEVDEILAVATSATREAENGGAFLDAIERTTGIRPRTITGTEEARLIHSAAVYGVDAPGAAVVIDIGGGSVEVTLGTRLQVKFARSFKLGAIRLTERFVQSDPLTGRDERQLMQYVSEQVDRYIGHIVDAGYDQVIGTSGTILSVGTVAAALERGSVPNEIRNLRVSAKAIRRLRREVTALDLSARLKLPGLDPRRADLIVAGAVLVDTLLKKLDARELTLCDLALREGVVLDYISQHRKEIARVDRYPDVRRRSIIELAERCSWEADHSQQVARLALLLFDQTAAIHKLGAKERAWLEYAALVHDVGMHISYERHHRHSYYLIKNGDLRGFEPDEIEVIALLTRYHRRGGPSRRHEGYSELPGPLRRTVRVLSGFLRLAEALDRSKHRTVKTIDVRSRGKSLLIRLSVIHDPELEMWAAVRHLELMGKELGREVRLEARRLQEPEIAPRGRKRKAA